MVQKITLRTAAVIAVILILSVGAGALPGNILVQDTIPFNANNGPTVNVTVVGQHNVDFSKAFVDDNTIDMAAVGEDAIFQSTGTTFVTVKKSEITGTSTIVSDLDVTGADLLIAPDDKPNVTVGDDITDLSFTTMAIDGPVDFTYSASGIATITVNGLTPNTLVSAATPSSQYIDTDTTDSTGAATFTLTPGSNRDVLLFAPEPPFAVNASASPSTSIEDNEATLSIDIGDAHFATQVGDTVTVDFNLDGSQVDTQSITSAQTVSYATGDVLGEGTHTWNVTLVDESGLTASSADITFDVIHHNPIIDAASASLTGGQPSLQPDLSVDISDIDFSDSTGDTVTVDFLLNGNQIGTDTLSSNGTAEISSVNAIGGTNTWSIIATDSYGKTTTSQTFSFQAPAELEIRNQTANANGDHELIDSAETEIEFYFDGASTPGLIIERSTNTGVINMTGLPVNQPFVVDANADDYFNRRIFVSSLFETQTVYLLDDTADVVQPIFELNDATGQYDTEHTVLEIQRNINGSWQTVEGDYFGIANRVSAQLLFNERHRLVITNTETGASRNLGPFTPTSSNFIELTVEADDSIVNQAPDIPRVTISPQIGSLPARANTDIQVQVEPGTKTFTNYNIKAILSNGTILHNQSHANSNGDEHDITLDLDNTDNQELTVWVNWTATDGSSNQIPTVYTLQEFIQNDYSLLTILTNAPLGEEPPNALSSLITVVLAILATGYTATRMAGGPAALVGLGVITMGAILSWIPFGWLVAGAVTWVVLSGVRNRI